MARSRHGHRAAEPVGGTGLPSWAQRHLGEAGESAETVLLAAPSTTRHRRRAAPEPTHRLKGWGVAVVSVAAAVGAVPLAISSVAANRSDDPLPTVNTFTAGAPGPLEAGGAPQGGGTRTVPAPPGDPSTGGILEAPAGAPGAPAAPGSVVQGRAVPAPQPAAVVRPSVPAASSTTTAPARPLAGTSTTAPKPKPTTSTPGGSSGDDEGPRTAPKPAPAPAKPPASSSGPSNSGGNGGGSGGLLPAVGRTAGGVVGGLTNTVGGLL